MVCRLSAAEGETAADCGPQVLARMHALELGPRRRAPLALLMALAIAVGGPPVNAAPHRRRAADVARTAATEVSGSLLPVEEALVAVTMPPGPARRASDVLAKLGFGTAQGNDTL
eukprot:SAG31_NODE_1813_length_7211_cov_9.203600_2_plen_115_part_00